MPAMPSSRYIFGTLPWYSVLIVTGICAAYLLASREEKRVGLPKDTVLDLALWLIPSGVIGARLYYVFFAWDTFAGDPLSILYIWRGGLAIYGAIIGGALAALIFSHHRKLPLPRLTDIIVPGLALAQAIGRWGNYFNMEAYGLAVTNPAWQFFPFAVLIPESGGNVWHMATFFYESIWNLGVFAALMFLRKRAKRTGDITLWYALLYGGGRLIVEGLRLDSLMTVGGSGRVSQLLSVGICLTVLLVFAWRALRKACKRQLIIGCATLAASLALLLLPSPSEAFFGYRAAWVALMSVAAAALAMITARHHSSIRHFLPLALAWAAWLTNLLVSIRLASLNYEGPEIHAALCLLFTVNVITACGAVYHAIPSADVSEKSSNL